MSEKDSHRNIDINGKAFRDSLQILTTYPAVWIGFACLSAWPWISISATLVHENVSLLGSPVWLSTNFTYFFLGVGSIFWGALHRRMKLKTPSSTLAIIAGICCVAGSALYVLISKIPLFLFGTEYLLASFFWPLFIGAGRILLFIEWGKTFGAFGPKKATVFIVAASLFGTLLLFSLNYLPQQIKELFPVLIGIVSASCAYIAAKQRASLSLEGNQVSNPKANGVPWKLLITAIVAGCSFGVFQGLSFAGFFGESAWYVFGVIGFLSAAILFVLINFAFHLNFNYMIYRFAFVIMALGGFISILSPAASAWGYGLFCIGYRCFDMLGWCLCAYLVYHHKASPGWLAGLYVGMLFFGRLIGSLTSGLFNAGLFPFDGSILIGMTVFILLLTALFLVSHNNLLEAWGMVKPQELDDNTAILEIICTQITAEYHLSAREQDVLKYLAAGKNRAEISCELILSEETIKTHIRHIYQKCGIHSRDELSAMIEEGMQAIQESRLKPMSQNASEQYRP